MKATAAVERPSGQIHPRLTVRVEFAESDQEGHKGRRARRDHQPHSAWLPTQDDLGRYRGV
jgi:hypothetical protein